MRIKWPGNGRWKLCAMHKAGGSHTNVEKVPSDEVRMVKYFSCDIVMIECRKHLFLHCRVLG